MVYGATMFCLPSEYRMNKPVLYNEDMTEEIKSGDCVKIPDGRIARVRSIENGVYRVRVRRKTSQTHQFLVFERNDLTIVDCPEGWMRPQGYNRYLKITLEKMQTPLQRRER